MRTRLTTISFAIAIAISMGVAACGDDDPDVIVGSADFGESRIIAAMYAEILDANDYNVSENFGIGSREQYLNALQEGEIDVVPEYIGTLTEFFNTEQNGPEASINSPRAVGDPATTFQALQGLLEQEQGLQVTPYAQNATDQNSFAVTRETADEFGLSKLSDLAKPEVQGQLVLGAGAECETRPFCLLGLQQTYGASFRPVSDGAYEKFPTSGGPETISALKDDTIDIGLVFTSDSSVEDNGLVRLEDDRALQPADNITALYRSGTLNDEAIALINRVDETLTTDDLKELNRRFNIDKEDPEDIAREYLEDHDLI